MIEGFVNTRYEAVITIAAHGPTGQTSQVDAVIDTGFTEFLVVPSALVSDLELAFVGISQLILANGSVEIFDVYRVSVLWDGQLRNVDDYIADAAPLVGMRMLDGYNLNIDVEDGGRVLIRTNRDDERGREARN